MIIWTWLVSRIGQLAAGALGIGLLMALITGLGTFLVSWIRDGANAEWLREINAVSERARIEQKARSDASEKAAQAERDKAQADAAVSMDRVRYLEAQLKLLTDDPVCFPKSIARSLRK
ncbi:hypothetical protein [Hyphomicrobium sp. DY-1]|uniref:hypothetical protein n=1 Tax=Hyphomicrobium sp. DY-1 TaxID=3075650 RepID=UPI0039C407AD